MTMNKLLLGAASIALPFGIATAQTPSTSSAATGTAPEAVSQDTTTDSSAGATGAAIGQGSSTTTADAAATGATSQSGTPVQVTKADVTTGATVSGSDGGVIGKVESVSADAATVSTGKARAQIPFASIGKTDKGLVIAMSKAQFEAAASGKSPS